MAVTRSSKKQSYTEDYSATPNTGSKGTSLKKIRHPNPQSVQYLRLIQLASLPIDEKAEDVFRQSACERQ
jgi:hypothetical protein